MLNPQYPPGRGGGGGYAPVSPLPRGIRGDLKDSRGGGGGGGGGGSKRC